MKTGFLVVLFCVSLGTNAASFDCKKASTNVEKMVCIDSILSKQDEKLHKLYSSVLQKIEDKESFKSGQRRWLKEVRNKCESAMCLMQVYDERIAQLNSLNMVMVTDVEMEENFIAPAKN